MSRKQRRPAPPVAQITAGAGPTVTAADGRVYRLGFNTQDAKARLESLVCDHVTLEAVRRKRRLGGADGDEAFAAVQALIDAGHYSTLERGWLTVLHSADGAILFPLALLQEHHPEMTAAQARELFAAEPEQVRAALGRVAPDFFHAVLVQVSRAKGLGPDRAAATARQVMGEPAVRAALAELVEAAGPPATRPAPATG